MRPLTSSNSRQALETAIEKIAPAEVSYDGTGIVICGGGLRYFTCAWVCINMLRHVGCDLPIQLWHLNAGEITERMRQLLLPLGVSCIDASKVREHAPVRILNGWELKAYSMIHSPYRHVLLLDADNVPLVDPQFLFQTPEYLENGAIFWPDFGRLSAERSIWPLTGVEFRDEPEFETGQIVVDKDRCWRELALTMWMNENSDFWYQHIHGDKETFHIAWRKLDRTYGMPSRMIHRLDGTMCQHDFTGRRIFQHRNLKKWLIRDNPRVRGFALEEQCLAYLSELWPHYRELSGVSAFDPEHSKALVGKHLTYRRVGYDSRELEFLARGIIGKGSDRMERWWGITRSQESPILEIFGDDGLTAKLYQDATNQQIWKGSWLIHERMPVELEVASQ